MPNGKKKYPRKKSNREIRKEAKQEAGKYGAKGKKIKIGSKTGGKEESKARDFSRKVRRRQAISKLTGGMISPLVKVGRGSGQPLDKKPRREPPVPKPDLEKAGTRTRTFVSGEGKDKGKVVQTSRTDQAATTTGELAKKTTASVKKTGMGDVKDPGFKEAPEFKKNVGKLSAYAKAKAAREKRKAEGKYVPGSRTQSQRAKDAALDLAKAHAEKKYGQRKGTRKLFKTLKKQKKEKRRTSPKAVF